MNWNTIYNPHNVPGEQYTKPSLVVPNEAMSIREILVRYSRGLPIDSKVPMYDEENFLPDVKYMDLADLQTMRENIAQEIEEKKQIISKQKEEENERKQQAKAEQIRKLREELFAHQPDDKTPMQNQKQPQ
ncbi:MAG: hypothetical protein [Arizlama microvirus]|nr:MAG: hypothetical protein [Arizlama microvirus]